MPENCTYDCSTCGQSCAIKKPASLLQKPLDSTHIKKIIGVVSGKGGVGKSMITSLLAISAAKQGFKVGIMDSDITGPSIPKAFGITSKAKSNGEAILPEYTKLGIKVMSMNLLTENDTDPVIWRGPVIAGAVTQFWTDVLWGDLDYLFIDMPPGTGDVPLTVFQSIPIDGIVVVTSPQDLVGLIVEKAIQMAKKMNIPIKAIVENMSYFKCPHCGQEYKIFGDGNTDYIADMFLIDEMYRLPIDPELAAACDHGRIEFSNVNYLNELLGKL